MAIVSKKVAIDRVQKDGRRDLTIELTDDTGKIHTRRVRKVPADFDAVAYLEISEQKVLAAMGEKEVNDSIDKLERGVSSLNVFNNAKYATKKDIAKHLIRHAMAEGDAHFMLKLEPLIENLKSRFSGAQIAALLDIDSDQLTRFNAKYDAIVRSKTDLETANTKEVWK